MDMNIKYNLYVVWKHVNECVATILSIDHYNNITCTYKLQGCGIWKGSYPN